MQQNRHTKIEIGFMNSMNNKIKKETKKKKKKIEELNCDFENISISSIESFKLNIKKRKQNY